VKTCYQTENGSAILRISTIDQNGLNVQLYFKQL
jgi:hypothetical protein